METLPPLSEDPCEGESIFTEEEQKRRAEAANYEVEKAKRPFIHISICEQERYRRLGVRLAEIHGTDDDF